VRDLVGVLDGGLLLEVRAPADGAGAPDRVRLLRSFAAAPAGGGLDVADPYYGDDRGFATVLSQVEEGCRGILAMLERDVRPAG
jgi:protein-tyrosine phosphatase